MLSAQLKKLFADAEGARPNAYSKYSGVSVGAALLFDNGKSITGVNVENASYGLTICAERSALAAAVSLFGSKIRVVAVAVSAKKAGFRVDSCPCGACRQVLFEFAKSSCEVIYTKGRTRKVKPLFELLPDPFILRALDDK